MLNYTLLDDPNEDRQAKTDPDLNFEVRSERLATTTDTPATDSWDCKYDRSLFPRVFIISVNV